MYQQRAVISRHINIYCCKGRRVCSNVTVDGDQTTFAYHCSQPSSDAEILTRYSYSVSIRLFLSLCADAKLSQPRPRRCHVMLIHKILPARFWPHTTAIIVFFSPHRILYFIPCLFVSTVWRQSAGPHQTFVSSILSLNVLRSSKRCYVPSVYRRLGCISIQTRYHFVSTIISRINRVLISNFYSYLLAEINWLYSFLLLKPSTSFIAPARDNPRTAKLRKKTVFDTPFSNRARRISTLHRHSCNLQSLSLQEIFAAQVAFCEKYLKLLSSVNLTFEFVIYG